MLDKIILKTCNIEYSECIVIKIYNDGDLMVEYEVDENCRQKIVSPKKNPLIKVGMRGEWIIYSKCWSAISRFDDAMYENPEKRKSIIKMRLQDRNFENTSQCNGVEVWPEDYVPCEN